MILLGDGYHHEYCQEYHIVLCLIYICNKCLIFAGGVVRVFVVDQIVDISRWYGALCVVSRSCGCSRAQFDVVSTTTSIIYPLSVQ